MTDERHAAKLGRDERRARLARQINLLVAQGRRVESQDDYNAVLTRGRIVERRELVSVDEWGNPSLERLPLDKERVLLVALFALAVVVFLILAVTAGDDGGDDEPTVILGALLTARGLSKT